MKDAMAAGNDDALFEPDDISHALAQIARLAEGVKSEFDLIGGRMNWLGIAESFIFSAFATVEINGGETCRRM